MRHHTEGSWIENEREQSKTERAVISTVSWIRLGKEQQQETIKALQEELPEFRELYPEKSYEDALVELAWLAGFHDCMMHIESGCVRPAQWQCEIPKSVEAS